MKTLNAKDLLFEQVARIGKAMSNPKRLELLELLSQGEKTVETLANESHTDLKLTSAHLKALKEARLVITRRAGKYIHYRLAGADIANLWLNLRAVAGEHLIELRLALAKMSSDPSKLVSVSREQLLQQAKNGDVVVIDVRPTTEYQTAHLPFARSLPLTELLQRLNELPRDKDIVAYCRGPFCLLSDEAVELLTARGFHVRKTLDGVNEWQAAGFPLSVPT